MKHSFVDSPVVGTLVASTILCGKPTLSQAVCSHVFRRMISNDAQSVQQGRSHVYIPASTNAGAPGYL
jgi:hypothetical protein